ncbi:MAG: hypothetical protein GXY23_08920 [Myxococcales bacterium]|nr:hypothetical protein [Myxococcales bacterium]
MWRRVLLSFVILAGCNQPTEQGSSEAAPKTAEAPKGNVGTVVGVVRLREGASLPRLAPGHAGSAKDPAPSCPRLTDADPTPVFERDGKLVNVLVSATGNRETFFAALPERTASEVELVIGEDCRLSPRLVAAVVGDSLRLRNRSPLAVLPFIGKQGHVESLSSQESRVQVLSERGVHHVGCGVTGYCGSADVVVLAHPVFGVTDETGTFVIDNVPADQDVVLHAWHPLFREATTTVRVGKGERVEVELEIEPARTRP